MKHILLPTKRGDHFFLYKSIRVLADNFDHFHTTICE